MTTTAPELDKLTKKQRQVYDLLDHGVAIPDIAKRMKITRTGVYGHMRHIRRAGITLPNEQVAGDNGQRADVPAPDLLAVLAAPEKAARAALEEGRGTIDERTRSIDERLREMAEEVASLKTEREELLGKGEQYDTALQALS